MKVVIISGFFNPLHGGHLDMIESAAALGDKLIVIVNNDIAQLQKKGKIILNEANRTRLLGAIKQVDEVVLSIDQDLTIVRTLEEVAKRHKDDKIIFANGGDRDSEKAVPEADICHRYSITMIFDAGGTSKADSSTRINQALGHAK